jgi:hypothetical protein
VRLLNSGGAGLVCLPSPADADSRRYGDEAKDWYYVLRFRTGIDPLASSSKTKKHSVSVMWSAQLDAGQKQ